ncbi:MAG: penicillin-binding transpeptidase domain-containing protein [Firmicutes bacterium]|nr:penicillin-binding transpeptidase domain-containing protein [Bacillota bacterium]
MPKNRKKRVPVKQQRDRYAKFIGAVLTLVFIILCYRIYHIQAVDGDYLRQRALRQQSIVQQHRVNQTIPASRGEIMDRHMQPIASTIPVFEIFMDVNLIHEAGDRVREAHIDALHRHLGIPIGSLTEHFRTDNEGNLVNPHGASHRIVARDIEPDVASYLTTNFTHIHSTRMSKRFYHDPFFAPQVIGFTRGDTRWGLEAAYNTELAGSPGRLFVVQGETEEIPVRDGYTLITTLDSDIQRLAQSIVDQTYTEMNASFVGKIVVDPHTGEVLAMAQAPTFSLADPFNPNYITDRQLQREWDYLSGGEQSDRMNYLWRNFHIFQSYEPGSIFKPVVMAAAIEEGVLEMSPYRPFHCNRDRFIGTDLLRCWTSHGALTFRSALYRSCNIAMFDIMNLLGHDATTFYRYRGYFGFAARTGIDLPGEASVSSRAVMYGLADLGRVERATSSIGQGFNATTIQSIMAYAALINGGNMLQPFLVSHIIDSHGNIVRETQPTIVRRAISQETSDFIRREMQHVVSAPGGTAHSALIPGHAIGGKTGTGQQGRRAAGIDSLSYVSFLPIENPQFLALMVVHEICTHSYHGAGRELGPRMRRFFEEIISIRGIPPSDGPNAANLWEGFLTRADVMPDYSGQRLVDAVEDLSNRSQGGYQVVGSGTIVSHTIPAPGRPMPQNSLVTFHMESETRVDGHMAFVPDLEGLTVNAADSLLREIGLRPLWLHSLTPQTTSNNNGIPRTTNPDSRDEDDPSSDTGHSAQLMDRIYQQFPAPGVELEWGTMVMFRAR